MRIDPGIFGVGGTLVANRGPTLSRWVITLDGVSNSPGRPPPCDQAAEYRRGNNQRGRNVVLGYRSVRHHVSMVTQLLSTGTHILCGHHERSDPRIIEGPPFPTLAFHGVLRIMGVCRNRLKTEIVEVGLKRPEAVARDFGIVSNGVKKVLQVGG